MNTSVALECQCGQVSGHVEVCQKEFFHIKCLCSDCQEFAARLNRENDLLDGHGGTELFQTYPAHVKITQGADKITMMRLSPKGLQRHHTTCCNTPVGNMVDDPKLPFIGIPVTFLKFASDEEKDKVLGPISLMAFGKDAKNGKPSGAADKFPLSAWPKMILFMIKGYFKKKFEPRPYC